MISSLFPKRGNRNTKRTEKHKNKMTHGKTYNKSPRRINHKTAKSKINTGTNIEKQSLKSGKMPLIFYGIQSKVIQVVYKLILNYMQNIKILAHAVF